MPEITRLPYHGPKERKHRDPYKISLCFQNRSVPSRIYYVSHHWEEQDLIKYWTSIVGECWIERPKEKQTALEKILSDDSVLNKILFD